MTDEQNPANDRDASGTLVETRVRVRRVPRFGTFLVAGAVLGVLVALVLTAAFQVDPSVGFAATWGYFALWGVAIGLVVGAVASLVLDRILSARGREVAAERLSVDALPYDDEIGGPAAPAAEQDAAPADPITDAEPEAPASDSDAR